jgi:hypothetical protein
LSKIKIQKITNFCDKSAILLRGHFNRQSYDLTECEIPWNLIFNAGGFSVPSHQRLTIEYFFLLFFINVSLTI